MEEPAEATRTDQRFGGGIIASSGSRLSIRIAIGVLIVVSAAAMALLDIPTNAVGESDLPSVALGQELLYRVEIFLLVFYGGLLVITPAYRGVISGRLPAEISVRGAKFPEEVVESIGGTQALMGELQEELKQVQANSTKARLNIDQIAEETNVELRD